MAQVSHVDAITHAANKITDAGFQQREAAARAAVTDRLLATLKNELQRQGRKYPGFRAETTSNPTLLSVDGILSVDELAGSAASVLVQILTNPPTFVTGLDGVERIEWSN